MPNVYSAHKPRRAARLKAVLDSSCASLPKSAASLITTDFPLPPTGLPVVGLPLGKSQSDQATGRIEANSSGTATAGRRDRGSKLHPTCCGGRTHRSSAGRLTRFLSCARGVAVKGDSCTCAVPQFVAASGRGSVEVLILCRPEGRNGGLKSWR